MEPAVASLLGAIIGGAIASGTTFGLDARRSKRDRAETSARDHREAQRAARLIAEELESGRRLLAHDREKGIHTGEPPERQLPASTWTEYRADFARVASLNTWDATADAYAAFDQFNWHVRAVVIEEDLMGVGPESPMDAPASDRGRSS